MKKGGEQRCPFSRVDDEVLASAIIYDLGENRGSLFGDHAVDSVLLWSMPTPGTSKMKWSLNSVRSLGLDLAKLHATEHIDPIQTSVKRLHHGREGTYARL